MKEERKEREEEGCRVSRALDLTEGRQSLRHPFANSRFNFKYFIKKIEN
jgi:hypothetical protein